MSARYFDLLNANEAAAAVRRIAARRQASARLAEVVAQVDQLAFEIHQAREQGADHAVDVSVLQRLGEMVADISADLEIVVNGYGVEGVERRRVRKVHEASPTADGGGAHSVGEGAAEGPGSAGPSAGAAGGSAAYLQAAVDIWNGIAPIGTPVRYWTGFREGDGIESKTRTKAQLLCGTPVVWVEGHGACIALSHVALATEGGAS